MNVLAIAPTTVLWRLLLALLLGAIIGLERERQHRPAGLRTHMLVTLSSALFAMISIIAAGEKNDPGRIAAQVVTGIGFLGAGTIMRYGSTVKGLTTAASLWTAAAIGLAVGFGCLIEAVAAALLAFLVLVAVKAFEERLTRSQRRARQAFYVIGLPGKNPLPAIMTGLRALGAQLHSVKLAEEAETDRMEFTLVITPPPSCDPGILLYTLRQAEGVRDVEAV